MSGEGAHTEGPATSVTSVTGKSTYTLRTSREGRQEGCHGRRGTDIRAMARHAQREGRARRDRKCVVPSCCAVTRTVAVYLLYGESERERGSPGFSEGVVYVSLATIGS